MVVTPYKTTLQKFLFPATFIALLGVILGIISILVAANSPGWLVLLLSAVAFALSISLMLNFNTCYEFSGEDGQVFFKVAWLSLKKRFPVALNCEVTIFTVVGIHNWARVHSWWSYKVVMLLKSGKMLAVSDRNDKSVHSMNRLAEKLAATLGCEYFPGQQEKTVRAAIAGERPVLEYHDWCFSDTIAEFWPDIVLSLLFFAAIMVFIVAVVIILS